MAPEPQVRETTEDAVLGGRLRLRQPKRGHRVGHDAILLAAACPAHAGERAFDLGAGIGSAGLALARRVDGLRVTLVEIDPALCALAGQNAHLNKLEQNVEVLTLDAGKIAAGSQFEFGRADRVLMNPPFNDTARAQLSPDPARRLAHAASAQTLPLWIEAASRLLDRGGTLTLIWRADEMPHVLDAVARRFGDVTVLPVHPLAGAPPIRVLLHAEKGARSPPARLEGLILNGADGRPTPVAEAVLREGETLPLAKI
ncbi:MAG: tRNA1(Val) (adenine(37)-N6)-methyltransferase [Pseudolabrys sp.]